MTDNPKPLPGYSRRALADIREKPRPCLTINHGAGALLMREGLVEIVQLPSPYKMHGGAPINHFKITVLGEDRLRLDNLNPR